MSAELRLAQCALKANVVRWAYPISLLNNKSSLSPVIHELINLETPSPSMFVVFYIRAISGRRLARPLDARASGDGCTVHIPSV